jgi:geranylgeranyl diphosphate synthase, type II
METTARIEQALQAALAHGGATVDGHGCPPKLGLALHDAVFPGGARVRPHLCLAVARACGDDEPRVADAAAAAIELLHCASLVHDDLPCFDDAALRRGKPSVHVAFGERIAVLAGDALIVLAFQTLVAAAAHVPQRLAQLAATIGRGVGAPRGIVAGQAWECEPCVALPQYQRAKTGALFAAATQAGAQAAGADGTRWIAFGQCLGEAYQVADDIRDVAADAAHTGKPRGQDTIHGRPSIVTEMGLGPALGHFRDLVQRTADAVPPCAGEQSLRALVRHQAERLMPQSLRDEVALLAA